MSSDGDDTAPGFVDQEDGVRTLPESLSPTQPSRVISPPRPEIFLPVPPPEPGWPELDEAAYFGLPGEFVKAVEPHSEADPVGILLHILIGAGNMIGSGPHAMVEHAAHPARLNALSIGRTASGRKGTAWHPVRYVLSNVDSDWTGNRIRSGLSSGEGLILPVAGDETRLLIIESEFASTLKVMERDGNTLSPVIRDAWDHGNLSFLTKREPLAARGAHISIIGHITTEELTRSLTATEKANGFANRFLFALVRRSRLLPSGKGTPPEVINPYFSRFLRTIQSARARGEVQRDDQAEALWAQTYPRLEEEIPGLTGTILARGAAQTLRLSLIFCLLDEKESEKANIAIRTPHVLAALAVWDYCKASVKLVFGDSLGDPMADKLYRAIKAKPQTDTMLNALLSKHDNGRKDAALALLMRHNRIHSTQQPTGGRPTGWWHEGEQGMCVICVKSAEMPRIRALSEDYRPEGGLNE